MDIKRGDIDYAQNGKILKYQVNHRSLFFRVGWNHSTL